MSTTNNETLLPAKRENMFNVPWTRLRIIAGLNVRTDYGDITELAESILANGVEVPIKGPGKKAEAIEEYNVIHGHRRYTAGKLIYEQAQVKENGETMRIVLGEREYRFGPKPEEYAEGVCYGEKNPKHIHITADGKVEIIYPFTIEESNISEAQRIIDMIVTNTGKPLTPLELAGAVKRLLESTGEEKWDFEKIGKKLGKSKVYIANLNQLLAAPEKFKKLVEKGTVSGTYAIELVKKGQVENFMAEYNTGKFDKKSDKGDQTKNATITKRQVVAPNSLKHYRIFATTAAKENMKPEKLAAFEFFEKILDNAASSKEIYEFFHQ